MRKFLVCALEVCVERKVSPIEIIFSLLEYFYFVYSVETEKNMVAILKLRKNYCVTVNDTDDYISDLCLKRHKDNDCKLVGIKRSVCGAAVLIDNLCLFMSLKSSLNTTDEFTSNELAYHYHHYSFLIL